MAVTPKVPGVYIDRDTILPIGLDLENRAIPVFLGYTEKGGNSGEMILVTSIQEYSSTLAGPTSGLRWCWTLRCK